MPSEKEMEQIREDKRIDRAEDERQWPVESDATGDDYDAAQDAYERGLGWD